MYREALDVWRRLGTGEYREPEPSGDPPGLDDTVEFLSRTNEVLPAPVSFLSSPPAW
jgi:hypothetical protein